MISTHHLDRLPDLSGFRRLTQSLAALDAALCPDWSYRYYSFDAAWSEGGMMASMRDGSGDGWFALISEPGVALLGLDHEAPTYEVGTPKPWVFRDLPPALREGVLSEPAFDAANVTFCVWRLASDDRWRSGVSPDGAPVEDGSGRLLRMLEGEPEQYVDYASDYFGVDLNLVDVQDVYDHAPLTLELATRLNGVVDHPALLRDLGDIGYP